MRTFPRTLSSLRKEKKLSQREVAADLNISQALLSHYENGLREPGLKFVCKVCDYYGVTADYLLCRSDERNGAQIVARASREFLEQIKSTVEIASNTLERMDGDLAKTDSNKS